MAKNEAFKICRRRGTGLWSWWMTGRGAVRYSTKYWTTPKREAIKGRGKRLSVFKNKPNGVLLPSEEIWRCVYRGKLQIDNCFFYGGTLRVTSVKLIERVWPKKETNDGKK